MTEVVEDEGARSCRVRVCLNREGREVSIEIFVIEKLGKGEYSGIIEIIIILESIGLLKMNKDCENL